MRNTLLLLAALTTAGSLLCACDSDDAETPDAMANSLDGGNASDASLDDAAQAAADAAQHDAQADAAMSCESPPNPLFCGQVGGCPVYKPLARCPEHGQVREGLCGPEGELRLRVWFDTGGENIDYWERDSGKLVATQRASDVLSNCDGTHRVFAGDLKRIASCEEYRGEQEIVCAGQSEDSGVDDAG